MTQLRIVFSSALGLLAGGLLAAAPLQETGDRFRPETLRMEPYQAERAAALAAVLGFANWPRPAELYAAPAVSRALFAEPARVSEEVRSCTTVRFGNEPWERCVWSWKALGEERRPAAADALDLEITLTPSSRAAQEYLLTVLADNMMDTATLVKLYGAAKRPEGLGDVAILIEPPNGSDARLSFTRANVVLRIRGYGALRDEVLPLARRLDERLLDQPSLTLEQLRARQPPRPDQDR
jgi:hypothetical protein